MAATTTSSSLDWEIAPPDSYHALSFSELVEEEDECILCQISNVQSQHRFWVVPKMHLKLQRRMQRRLAKAVPIMEAKDFRLSPHQLRRNVPVVAQYSVDGKWYRGRVEETGAQDCFVQFVDFGNTSFVPLQRLFPLPTSFLDLPTAAIQCRMSGVDTRGVGCEDASEVREGFPGGTAGALPAIGTGHRPQGTAAGGLESGAARPRHHPSHLPPVQNMKRPQS